MPMSPRLLRPRASGFSPKSLANLALWMDASDSSTVTTVSGGVSEWRDKSGFGRVFSQGTANNRPTVATNAIGTKTAIRFDGSNDRLTSTTAANDLLSPLTLFIVARKSTAASDGGLFTLDKSGGVSSYSNDSTYCITTNANSAGIRVLGGANSVLFPGVDAVNVVLGSFIASLRIVGNNDGTLRNLISGNSSSDTTFTFSSTPSNTGCSLGVISADSGGGNTGYVHFLNGDIAEVVAYSRALSTSEQASVARYLASKYGLTLA